MKTNQSFAGKPLLFDAVMAHKNKLITFLTNGSAKLKLPGHAVVIPPDQQYDLTQATIFGLNERLTMSSNSPITGKNGKTLREEFNEEWERYSKALATADKNSIIYGVYAYYPEKMHLVRFCKKYWHHVVAVASSSKLYANPADTLTWKEIRELFAATTVAVAGCSVGNSIIQSTAMDLRPHSIKIADKSLYKMENINRVRLGYWEMVESNQKRKNAGDILLKNKALVTAAQLYAIDPFMNVYVYPDGISEVNIKKFLGGGGREPAADIVVEEVDDPRIKILIRQHAKRLRLPLIMVTDVGSCIQLDIVRFDKLRNSAMTYGSSDARLIASMEAVYNNPGNRKVFFKFVDQLIGRDYRQEELKKIIEQKTEIPTSTIIPQLGSTIAVAGGVVAEAIARIRLGFSYPPRVLFNKRTFQTKIYS